MHRRTHAIEVKNRFAARVATLVFAVPSLIFVVWVVAGASNGIAGAADWMNVGIGVAFLLLLLWWFVVSVKRVWNSERLSLRADDEGVVIRRRNSQTHLEWSRIAALTHDTHSTEEEPGDWISLRDEQGAVLAQWQPKEAAFLRSDEYEMEILVQRIEDEIAVRQAPPPPSPEEAQKRAYLFNAALVIRPSETLEAEVKSHWNTTTTRLIVDAEAIQLLNPRGRRCLRWDEVMQIQVEPHRLIFKSTSSELRVPNLGRHSPDVLMRILAHASHRGITIETS